MGSSRVNVKAILADADLRRKLMVSTIQATQAREGIDTTAEQADRAYYVVSESEKAAFFDLERFKGGRRNETDRRAAVFVEALRGEVECVRHDIARRDFSAIEGHPLAYQRVSIVAPVFREASRLEPAFGIARQGKATGDDPRWVRFRWEVLCDRGWVPFAKGGDYCRFYFDVELVLDWKPEHRADLKASGNALPSEEHYFKAGLTWPRRTQRGFNVRVLPSGCVFADKGPAVFPSDSKNAFFILGVMNSAFFEFMLQGLTSFGSWEVGAIQRMPIPHPVTKLRDAIGGLAEKIYHRKAEWNNGNELSSTFVRPWLLSADGARSLEESLHAVAQIEEQDERSIRQHYTDLNNEVFGLYGIPQLQRARLTEILGARPVEVLWQQMEGKTAEQKRMEHVWRLLSYAVKRVLEADDDGIVPFNAVNGEARLVERVRQELATLFPDHDANQVEVEIANELSKMVKGYRKCASLDDWLDNVFFEYHAGLYKNRPIFWHIASAQGSSRFAFGALVHYHRFDKNRMAKLRASYLRDAIEEFRREAGLADKAGRSDDRLEWQAKVEEAQALDRKLQLIQEGHHEGTDGSERDYRILTPWKRPEERPKGWDPDIDDGVKVNIEPFVKAGILRLGKGI